MIWWNMLNVIEYLLGRSVQYVLVVCDIPALDRSMIWIDEPVGSWASTERRPTEADD